MTKLQPEDLDKISERIRRTIILREDGERVRVFVHMGTCGVTAGARDIRNALLDEVEARNTKDVMVTSSSCAGLCSEEPMITVELKDQPPVKYVKLTPEKMKTIFSKHVIGGKIVTEYALAAGCERML